MGTSLHDSPATSAISSLLDQLTGGQAPQQPPAPTPQGSPSLFHRVLSNLAGIPRAIGHGISELERPQAPAEAQAAVQAGLLTPEQVQAARPSFLQSLALDHQPGGADAAYRQNIGGILGIAKLAQEAQQMRGIQQTRADIARLFPAPPNETPEQMDARLEGMYAYAVQHGDLDLAKSIGTVVQETVKRPKPEAKKSYEPKLFQDAQGGLHFVAPEDNKALPPDWKSVETAHAGVPQLFRKPNGELDWVLPGTTPPKGWKPEVTARTEFVQGMQQDRFDTRQTAQGAKDYLAQIKPLRDRAAIVDQALVTLNDAAHNPDPAVRRTLYTSAVANFVQAADQKAQIRYQLLQYFKNNIDPSIGGRWEVLKSRLLSGTLPQYSLEAMLSHLSNLKRLTADEIEAQRNDLIKRRPDLDGALPETDSFFPTTPNAPASAGAAGGKTITVNGKTFKVPE